MSGSPIHDIQTDLIVGMFVEYLDPEDHPEAKSALRYAVPSEALVQACPELLLRKPSVVLSSAEARLNHTIVNYALEVQEQYREYWGRFVSSRRPHTSAANLLPAQRSLWLDTGALPKSTSGQPTNDQEPGSSDKDAALQDRQAQGESTAQRRHEAKSLQPAQFGSLKAVFDALISSRDVPGIVLLAEPGAGKTLSLRHFAAQQAALLSDGMAAFVPVYVPLNTYLGQKNIEQYIKDTLSADSSLPFHLALADNLESVLSSHSLVLLFDGFNEIRGERGLDGIDFSEIFLSALGQFLAQVKLASCIFVIANRQPFATLERAWTVRLGPLDEVGVAQCLAIFSPEHAAEILASLEDSPKVQEVLANPFKVKAIAETYDYRGARDGASRVAEPLGRLYERLVFALVERERQRWINSNKEWIPFSDWKPHLQDLAYTLTERKTTVISRGELTSDMQHAATLASDCGLVGHSLGDIGFVHQQIQEFFAALWLQQVIADKGIGSVPIYQYASRANWDQPLLLLAGIWEGDLDLLIHEVARADPFLAAQCVGSQPLKVSVGTRSWLAEYLGLGLYDRWVEVPRERIMTALGEMRCKESLVRLMETKAADLSEDVHEVFFSAVANIDTLEAVQYLVDQIDELAKIDRWRFGWGRRDFSAPLRALTRMTSPEAASALEQALYDVRVSNDALKCLNSRYFPNLVTNLRTLLATQEEQIAKVVAELGVTELIPDLLPRSNDLTVSGSLLRLGAGQDIVDGYVDFQRFWSHARTWIRDFANYSGIDSDDINQPSNMGQRYDRPASVTQCLEYWYWFDRYLGLEAGQEYTRLLMNCVENSRDAVSRSVAIGTIACLRRYEAVPLLEKLSESLQGAIWDSSTSEAALTTEKVVEQLLYLRVTAAKAFLRLPPPIGHSRNIESKYRAHIRQQLPRASLESILSGGEQELAGLDTLRKHAYSVLQRSPSGHDFYGDLNNRILALEFLTHTGESDLHHQLIQAILQSISHCSQANIDTSCWDYPLPWRQANLIVTLGQKSPVWRKATLDGFAPMVFAPDRLSSVIAIDVIARLDGVEHIHQWLDLLNDRTWPVAYAVVDALGRMSVPQMVLDRLVALLGSRSADKRFFAALSLGSIGKRTHLMHLLTLADDQNDQVKWAVLWAVTAIGHAEPEVVDFVRACLSAGSSRVRGLAARAVGALQLSELAEELSRLLSDSDVRVIGEVAWSLGELQDTRTVHKLMTILDSFLSRGTTHLDSSYWFDKPEHRLPDIILQALGKVKGHVPVDRMDETLKEGNRTKGLRAVVMGELRQPPIKWLDHEPQAVGRPWLVDHGDGTPSPSSEPALEGVSVEELIRTATSAVRPEEREQAVIALAEANVDWYEPPLRSTAYDPSPRVRLARTSVRCRHRNEIGQYAYEKDLWLDLNLAMELSTAFPDSVLYLPTRSRRSHDEDPFSNALLVARLFPNSYDIDRLVQTLISQLQESVGRLGSIGFVTLCELASPASLHEVLDTFRQHPVCDSYDSPPHWFPLARKRLWSIVPELMTQLESGKPFAVGSAGICLAEMGVYQAADALRTVSRRLRFKGGREHVSASIGAQMAVIDLGQATTSDIGVLSALVEERSQFNDLDLPGGLYSMVANTLTNSAAEEAMRMWAELVFQDVWDEDRDWVNRGLRRWGARAVLALFEAWSEHANRRSSREMKGVLYGLLFPEQSARRIPEREQLSLTEQVLDILSPHSDQYFVPWLSDSNGAVRRLALHILAGRGSEHLEDSLEQLLQDREPEVVEAIFVCEMLGRLPGLSSAIQSIRVIGLETEEVDLHADQHSLGRRIVEAMRTLLNGSQEYPRHGAEMVRYYGLRQLVPDLHKTVREGDNDAAIEAIQTISHFRDASAMTAIVERIALSETDFSLALAGMEALITLGNLDSVREFILSESENVAKAAMNTIAWLNDLEAAETVATRLQDQEPTIVQAALHALSMLEYRPASGAIVKSLKHVDLRVVKEAVYACAIMELTQALPELREIENSRVPNLDWRQQTASIDSTDYDLDSGLPYGVTRKEDQARQTEKLLKELAKALKLAFFVLGELPSLPLDNDGTSEAKLGELQCATNLIGPRLWNRSDFFEDMPAGLVSKLVWLDFGRTGWFDERSSGTIAAFQKWLYEMRWEVHEALIYSATASTASSAFQTAFDSLLGSGSNGPASSRVPTLAGHDMNDSAEKTLSNGVLSARQWP